jgi:signal peptidase I
MTTPIIKRVIAVENQLFGVHMPEGEVFVDGNKIDEPYIKEKMKIEGDAEIPAVIPENHTFVMGDNRNGSTDSRFSQVGTVENEYILGKAIFVYFPFHHIKSL